ncbi:MAG TPA: ABC transporter permease [Candidatus Limnocylindria bacterium]|nr:ABC transporter permease [Candidatus Limnocylindria bacterium]
MAVLVAPTRRQIATRAHARRARRRRFGRLTLGAAVVAAIAAAVLAGPLFVPYAPEAQAIAERLGAPSAAHVLGTDAFGRDVLARLLSGGRVSLTIGLLSMIVTVAVGVTVGAISGFFGGVADALLMRLTELVMVFPTFFLIILVVATFGSSVPLLVLVIGLTGWPVGARVIRGEVLKVRSRDYVLAARAIGASSWRILARHIIPSVLAVIVISATIRVGTNILIEAGLSYLGLGVQPPLASWGNMIAESAKTMRTAWWLTAIPAAAIFLAVFGFNLFGEGVRDVVDPRRERPRGDTAA